MKTRTSVFSLALALLPCLAISQSQPAPSAPSVLVKTGKLLDVRKGAYIDGAAIWIEGDRIKEVGRLAEVQAHAPRRRQANRPQPCHSSARPYRLPHPLNGAFASGPDGYLLGLATNRKRSALLRARPTPASLCMRASPQCATLKTKALATLTSPSATPSTQALVEGPRNAGGTRAIAAVGQYRPFWRLSRPYEFSHRRANGERRRGSQTCRP